MKSRMVIILISVFLLVLVVSIPCAAEEIPPGTVIEVENYVYVADYESGKTVEVEEGFRLTPGDIIKTFDKASVTLGFGSDLVRLDANTKIEVVSTGEGGSCGGNTAISLISGTVFVKAERRTDNTYFIVATAGSIIETEGAEFTVESVIEDIPEGDPATEAFMDAIKEQQKMDEQITVFSVEITTTVSDGSVTSAIIDQKGGSTHSPVVIKKGEQITDRFNHAILSF